MKKLFKKSHKIVGKNILALIVRYKKFYMLKFFLFFFPNQMYKTLFVLMQRGYLNTASTLIEEYLPKEGEKALIERINSMNNIVLNGLNVSNKKSYKIDDISNILFVVHNSMPYEKAGYAIKTQMTIQALQGSNMKIIAVTRPGYPWDLQKYRDDLAQRMSDTIDNVTYLRTKDSHKLFKKGSDLNYIKLYAQELINIAKKENVSILHGHSNYLNGLATIEAANILSLPVIYEMRGLWYLTRLTLDRNYKYEGMFEYEHQMEMEAAKRADVVVTLSYAFKKLLVKSGVEAHKIEVIPNSVDTNNFKPLSENHRLIEKYNLQDKFVLGFVGSLTGYEGLKELVTAVDNLINEGLNLALVIVGDGKEKEKLQKLATSKDIIFTGRIPFSEVQEYYSIFKVCPLPRNNYDVCQYVPPLKLLEAMAMGKAIIVSDVDPFMEVIVDKFNGLVCESDNIESLQYTIRLLYKDTYLQDFLSKNAREWVIKNRQWKDTVKKYIEIYESFR